MKKYRIQREREREREREDKTPLGDFGINNKASLSQKARKVLFCCLKFMSQSVPIKITSGGDEDVWSPSYTSDGKFIIFATGDSFWKVRADGSGGRTKIPGSGFGSDYFPSLSKDNRIAFNTYNSLTNKYVIWTVDIDGRELTQLREGKFPSWSPDSKWIVFEYNDDIWIIGADGTNLTQITNTPDVKEGLPSFSPDGYYIVYVSNEKKSGKKETVGDWNIWTMKIDGGEKSQLTELESWDSWPVWGKDGIYFLSGRGKGKEGIVRIWKLKIQ
ncbi:MAG: DPP IV N-terminal domain-containing protein [bacterium]